MPTLHEETRFQRLRRYSTAHAWIEPLIFMALFHPFVWVVAPLAKDHNIISVTAALMAIPFLSILWHLDWKKDRRSELGIHFDNFRQSGREVAKMTLLLSVVIIVVGRLIGWNLELSDRTLLSMVKYLPWALGQQFVLQCFVYRRLRQACYPQLAIVITAFLFGTAHFPNFLLMAATTVTGFYWCRSFERTPNIITLAISQVILGTLLASQVPSGMSIGPRYWQ